MGKMILNGKEYAGSGENKSKEVTNLIQPASGIVLNSGFGYKAFQNGNVVTLSANGTIDSGYSSQGTAFDLFTIGDNIAPIVPATSYCWGAGSSNARVQVLPRKAITVTSGGWCSFTLSWLVN